MLQTIKEYLEEFGLLPNAVKMFIIVALFLTLGFGIYSGIGNFISNAKIARLEKENFELNRAAQSALEKAAKAETNAANEALRAEGLESKIKTLEAKGNTQDEKINLQTQKSAALRNDLNRVRVSAPANTSTADLERRLRTRYGQTNRSQ